MRLISLVADLHELCYLFLVPLPPLDYLVYGSMFYAIHVSSSHCRTYSSASGEGEGVLGHRRTFYNTLNSFKRVYTVRARSSRLADRFDQIHRSRSYTCEIYGRSVVED